MNKGQTPPTRNNYEQKPRPYPYSKDIQGYQKAVWDFLLEHSEVLPSGATFIKFHTSGKDNFQKRVFARWQYGYHREDVEKKGAEQENLRKLHTERKIDKEVKWEAYKAERKRFYKNKIRREKAQKLLQTLLRHIRALLSRGKGNS